MYKKYVQYEGKKNILYIRIIKALCGMLVSSTFYYKNFRKDIEAIGFKVNPYGICVANLMKRGKQKTITWHVDDLKYRNVYPKVNENFAK